MNRSMSAMVKSLALTKVYPVTRYEYRNISAPTRLTLVRLGSALVPGGNANDANLRRAVRSVSVPILQDEAIGAVHLQFPARFGFGPNDRQARSSPARAFCIWTTKNAADLLGLRRFVGDLR
jgi:hypothetical protein